MTEVNIFIAIMATLRDHDVSNYETYNTNVVDNDHVTTKTNCHLVLT